MKFVTVPLPYDINVGDFEAEAIDALVEIERWVASDPRSRFSLLVNQSSEHHSRRSAINLEAYMTGDDVRALDCLPEVLDRELIGAATDVEVTVEVWCEDDTAVLMKSGWPQHLPLPVVK